MQDELALLEKAQHPHVMGMLDAIWRDGVVKVMEMERAQASLHQVLGLSAGSGCGARLNSAVACQISCQICHAVAHTHKVGIMHRDLKSANTNDCQKL